MNSTFTREDNEQEAANVTRTLNDTAATNEDQNQNQNGEDPEETLLGYTRAEIIVMKHTLPMYQGVVHRLLRSNEFEVRRCTTGEIVSEGRCARNSSIGGGASNEELQKAINERDEARTEAEKQHNNYSVLFSSYDQMRKLAFSMRDERMDAATKLKAAVAEIDEWEAKFLALKENANSVIDKANKDMEELERSTEENTKGLRLRVKRLELEQESKEEEIRVLKKKVVDLTQICDQLLSEVDVAESVDA